MPRTFVFFQKRINLINNYFLCSEHLSLRSVNISSRLVWFTLALRMLRRLWINVQNLRISYPLILFLNISLRRILFFPEDNNGTFSPIFMKKVLYWSLMKCLFFKNRDHNDLNSSNHVIFCVIIWRLLFTNSGNRVPTNLIALYYPLFLTGNELCM